MLFYFTDRSIPLFQYNILLRFLFKYFMEYSENSNDRFEVSRRKIYWTFQLAVTQMIIILQLFYDKEIGVA